MGWQEYWRSSFLDLGLRSLRFQNSNLFSQKPLCYFKTKFYMKTPGRKEMKIYSNKFGHMIKGASFTIYGENPSKIFFSWTTDCHETWFVALWTRAHHNLFKWWPWDVHGQFYSKVKFGHLCFSIGKKWKIVDFF